MNSTTFKIAIFASGNGTNAEKIAKYFKNRQDIKIVLILSNKPDAYVHTRAENLDIPSITFNKVDFLQSDHVLDMLRKAEVDLVVLAGFLWLIPDNLIKAFPNRIVNIHPALLPKYGGKGMYGENVHRAVKAADEKETGITIHYVNQNYDEGRIIFQGKCELIAEDTVETIASKVHQLEYKHYPEVIEELIMKYHKNS
ncbi:phosphoribosylglycinamide formyltransferase [Fulvivirga sp. M361]|uniref:phosphoribosylglycinamide formyltransferase n=1 Tax=Fulvivirga sp. M361 TaxID=2594266 RepID=UPI00117A95EF|nr:phosphoribosylglycinamide formyltransferase [Fulvivirga sp. M361]TRX53730.1 phosphoribosylglycinamide formyltransferase [Fulvivirga sp. M361]